MIAGLGLAVGNQLKYVYDFGDWIEHQLTLGYTAPPQGHFKYPRAVGRNEARHAYCLQCQQKGWQTVAVSSSA